MKKALSSNVGQILISNLLCKSVDHVIHKRTLVLTTYRISLCLRNFPQDGLESLYTFHNFSSIKIEANIKYHDGSTVAQW